MNNIWITSDNHWHHRNIIQLCDRPFSSAEEMDEEMIKRWNSVVKKNDIVYYLGDFGFGNKEDISAIRKRLNGKIYLVMGNHCKDHSINWWLDAGFDKVYDKPIIVDDFYVLSHEPMPFTVDYSGPMVNLYGHVHNSPMFKTWDVRSVCVCVERHNYTPIKFDDIKTHFINQ